MRFRIVRWWAIASFPAAVLPALLCGPTAGQEVQNVITQPNESAVSESGVSGPAADVKLSPSKEVGKTALSDGPFEDEAIEEQQEEQPPLIPVADEIASRPVEIEAASFKGVVPGSSSMSAVEKAWGAPKEIQKQGSMVMGYYVVEPFKRVEVTFFQDKVTSVVIRLERTFSAKAVAQQLELNTVRPVFVSNTLGEILGQAFPERGVLFAFEPGEEPGKVSTKVSQIILEPIGPEPFLLRAETTLDESYEQTLSDLTHALDLQPDNARARWLRGRVLFAMGDYDKALVAAARAVRLEPGNSQYRLSQARILGQLGKLKEAIRETQKAIDASRQRPHVKASAMCLMGDLVASGLSPDYKSAIKHHMDAVQLADTLVTSRHPAIRIAAKEVLVDAHLGAAHDIAWGKWRQKEEAVTKWLNRADAFAEELVENEGGSQEHLLQVCTRSLAACVALRGSVDPTGWTTRAIRNAEQLINASDDSLRQAQLQWDLGMALYDALQIYQMRDDHDAALKYGERAVAYLEKGDPMRQSNNGFLLGRLYFRLGAIHAIRDHNHRAAITWFEKAVPLLLKPIAVEVATDLGRHGETFVSMGVSYWETDQREKAVELTEQGIEWMEKAVKQGTLDESSLAVPYDNLASMHRQLGHDGPADRFEEMADKVHAGTLR